MFKLFNLSSMLYVFYDCYVICYFAQKVPMILKMLFDLLEGVRTWKLLKGGVGKGESSKSEKREEALLPFC